MVTTLSDLAALQQAAGRRRLLQNSGVTVTSFPGTVGYLAPVTCDKFFRWDHGRGGRAGPAPGAGLERARALLCLPAPQQPPGLAFPALRAAAMRGGSGPLRPSCCSCWRWG